MAAQQIRDLLKASSVYITNESADEAAQRVGPTEEMNKASALMFNRIADYSPFDPSMAKHDLITVHRGDFKVFSRMDADNDDRVTKEEWNAYVEATHAEKRKKRAGSGDKWLMTLLHTLEAGCTQHDLESEQAQQTGEGPSEPLQESLPQCSAVDGNPNPTAHRRSASCCMNESRYLARMRESKRLIYSRLTEGILRQVSLRRLLTCDFFV